MHYKFCSLPFGAYYQISEEAQPRNSLVPRTQGLLHLDQVVMFKEVINSTP